MPGQGQGQDEELQEQSTVSRKPRRVCVSVPAEPWEEGQLGRSRGALRARRGTQDLQEHSGDTGALRAHRSTQETHVAALWTIGS